jgi:hypothetical protein
MRSNSILPLALALALLSLRDTFAEEPKQAEIIKPISERYAETSEGDAPSFQAHVLPLMGRLGCNGRACHGSFQGQGGFRLSLFGYDFKADHDALTIAQEGKIARLSTENPLESPILQKPIDESIHEGGKRMEKDSWQYNVLRRWIEAGAKDDSEGHARLERLEVTPASIHVRRDAESVSLKAVAVWSDGTREDVTPLCRFQTNDGAIAKISESGVVESTGSGDTHVVVFYDNGITPVEVVRPVSAETAANYPNVATPTKIDELVVAKLRLLGIVPSAIAGDADFLRRVSIDLTGTLPTPDEVKEFLASSDPYKRSAKVNELLDRPAYAAWWATKLCDLTGNNVQQQGGNQFRNVESKQWYEWLESRVKENMPYDKIVEGIVLATSRREGQTIEEYCQEMSAYYREKEGKSFAEFPVLPQYWARRNMQKPEEKALSFSYAFLGVRLQCAECHKHPFDQWSKHDFDQFKAFFAGIAFRNRPEDQAALKKMSEELGVGDKKGNEQQRAMASMLNEGKVIPFRELFVVKRGPAKTRNKDSKKPGTGANRVVTPKLLGGEEVVLNQGDPRLALMEWMRDPENPYFAKAWVNRVWANYFNVGIIEPADDLSLANPPSNAPLLDYLTKEFIASGYDLKSLHRMIIASDAYQRSWVPTETNRNDARNFSHSVPRRIPAEAAYDAIRQATAGNAEMAAMQTNMTDRMVGLASSTQGRGSQNYILSTFGKPPRLTNCDCERTLEPSLLQTLFLRNDGELLAQIERNNGWVSELTKERIAAEKQNKETKADETLSAEKVDEQIAKLTERIDTMGDAAKPEDLANAKRRLQRLMKMKERLAKADDAGEHSGEDEEPDAMNAKKIIEDAYLRTLSRFPTAEEIAKCESYFGGSTDLSAGARDLIWALLNTKEFIINH